jgi:hypothetical protein
MTKWTRRDKLKLVFWNNREQARVNLTSLLVFNSTYSSVVLYLFPMATTNASITNGLHYLDWDDRYYHVDQVLDRPGPRTDLSFMAGDGVSDSVSFLLSVSYTRFSPEGQKFSSESMQDPCHRRGWFGM